MSQSKNLTFSKVDYCPKCMRKLCKRIPVDGVLQIEFKHKGAEVTAQELAIKCMGCSSKFIVAAERGIVDEVA